MMKFFLKLQIKKKNYPTFDTLRVNMNISDLEQSMCRLPIVQKDVLDPSPLVEWQRTSHRTSFCVHSHLPQQVLHSEWTTHSVPEHKTLLFKNCKTIATAEVILTLPYTSVCANTHLPSQSQIWQCKEEKKNSHSTLTLSSIDERMIASTVCAVAHLTSWGRIQTGVYLKLLNGFQLAVSQPHRPLHTNNTLHTRCDRWASHWIENCFPNDDVGNVRVSSSHL